MVVDDSASARDALVEMLGAYGVRASAAASGEQALELLAQAAEAGTPYELVLMDYLMPGWDGVETIRRIRGDARVKATPAILMVSVCSREGVLHRARRTAAGRLPDQAGESGPAPPQRAAGPASGAGAGRARP
jgi:two-component system sensor histidine kinase/response regulator